MSNQSQTQRYHIGYAFTPEKEKTFTQPSLLACATRRGIDLIRIDPNKPLIEQGPFDCIIHKIYGSDWPLQLQHFSSQNPNVPVIDSPHSIQRLNNRISMLKVVSQLKINFENDTSFGVPKELVVSDMVNFALTLDFPVIAKPLLADGSVKSHEMYLIFANEGLEKLKLTSPIVLQEFVNHGGVVFKVYVLGSHVVCVRRNSLPDISEEKMKTLKGCLPFSQISNLCENEQKKGDDSCVEMPSENFVVELAKALREEMGLNLFNFDLIRDGESFLVIDINYFPGYEKLPDFESVMTDFLLDVVEKKNVEVV
ncbi:inositol-tetrakisphosphate 1-kinase 1-like [Pistacia vera]|uniref:inositol-tetrakisphosphate 1-kinase 1-like n=1 Tax=Pistacia vera TaxID=55513 RepID=UPI001262B0A0|nr:inositol-tetrakisphosphate 1-kinase 1-like [Pistacia vera]